MKYKAYPSYKESGVEWLGDAPSEWGILRHKFIASFSKGKNPSVLHDAAMNGTKKYLSMEYLRGLSSPMYGEMENNSVLVHLNQVLIIWDGSNAGEFVKSDDGILSSTMAVSNLSSYRVDANYYWYVCKTIELEVRKHANGMGIPHVNGLELKNIKLTEPPLQEQKSIANYLDKATAKIDTLIEKQTKLIELLKEKRQAVISSAVTRGLDTSVPMKDSGAEWLGEIPEGWGRGRLKYYVNTVNGFGFASSDFCDDGIPFIRAGNIKNKTITQPSIYLPQAVVEKYKRVILKKGDLVISMVGSDPRIVNSAVGQIAIIPVDMAGAVPNQNVVILHESSEILIKKFLFYVLCGKEYRTHLDIFSHKLANQSIISSSRIIDAKFNFPDNQEQKVIVNYLDQTTAKIDNLITKSTQAISLLKEKRTALISAAVTGKIDVRDAA